MSQNPDEFKYKLFREWLTNRLDLARNNYVDSKANGCKLSESMYGAEMFAYNDVIQNMPNLFLVF